MSAPIAWLRQLARDGRRTIADCIRSPGDAWLAARMAGWAVVLPVLSRVVPLPALVRLMVPRDAAGAGARDAERERRIVALTRLVYTPLVRADRGCLQRSLVAYRYLARAGAAPRLVVGMRRGEGAVEGHAWVTVDGDVRGDSPARVAGYGTVVAFGGDGRRLTA